jgi:phosphoglycolate phosphatase-like HAD superfamily hydrolase
MKTNAILFDLDGTLIDTAPDLAYALNEVLNSYSQRLEIVEKELVEEYYLGGTFVVRAPVWVACSSLKACAIHDNGDLRLFPALKTK